MSIIFTHGIDPWVNALGVEVKRKSNKIYVASSLSITEQRTFNAIRPVKN